MELTLILIAAVVIDTCLGEPTRYHPLVGFGHFAHWIERVLYPADTAPHIQQLIRGTAALVCAVTPVAAIAVSLYYLTNGIVYWLICTLIVYLAIGHASLRTHALAVVDALVQRDLVNSRKAVSYLVSRDTDTLDAQAVSAATIESVLENGNDAVFAALFWFIIAGIPGIVIYRLVNTLDAMWGYKNTRYHYFGRATAKLDDWLNYLPARLTATSYALLGNTRAAIHCWRTQGTAWKSPNAGPVMAAGAGALQVHLGRAAHYHGTLQQRPPLGCGELPGTIDIRRALTLVLHTLLLWLGVIAGIALLVSIR